MKKSNFTVHILEPNTGFLLTLNKEIPLEKRVFSDKIFLAVNDSELNWKEISIEEADIMKVEQTRLIEIKTNERNLTN